MRLQDVSAPAVMRAIREFDKIGRDTFLERHGFGRARDYFLRYNGDLYDSKAILGVVFEIQFGEPAGSKDFSGGLGTTVPILEGLGFAIVRGEPRAERASQVSPPHRTAGDEERVISPVRAKVHDHPDVILISCTKSKQPNAAKARDLYTSAYFRSMRRYAEASGHPWLILSAEHGLVSPDEWLEPYECYLPDMDSAYKRQWGQRVAEQLRPIIGAVLTRSHERGARSKQSCCRDQTGTPTAASVGP